MKKKYLKPESAICQINQHFLLEESYFEDEDLEITNENVDQSDNAPRRLWIYNSW